MGRPLQPGAAATEPLHSEIEPAAGGTVTGPNREECSPSKSSFPAHADLRLYRAARTASGSEPKDRTQGSDPLHQPAGRETRRGCGRPAEGVEGERVQGQVATLRPLGHAIVKPSRIR